MIAIRKSEDRGAFNHGWLRTKHSFSFGQYFDPRFMGFGPLRVINEDHIAGGGGFPTHGHDNMEIITYLIDGEIEHKDTLGTGSIIRPGEVQRMSAGSGIRHSENNADNDNEVHLLQIWLEPEERGIAPSYEQKAFSQEEKNGQFKLVGSRDGRDGSVTIHNDVDLYSSIVKQDEEISFKLSDDRMYWLQMVKGEAELFGENLRAGDGVAMADIKNIKLKAEQDTEVLLFDMPIQK